MFHNNETSYMGTFRDPLFAAFLSYINPEPPFGIFLQHSRRDGRAFSDSIVVVFRAGHTRE